MTQYGAWVSYGGDARIWLALGLLAVAGGVVFAGARLPLPAQAARPGRAATMVMLAAWVAAIVAFLVGASIYIRQYLHEFHIPVAKAAPADHVAPFTFLAVVVIFIIILVRGTHRFWISLASAAIGAMGAPLIFEFPFDLIVLTRTYPSIPPDPSLYRALFFVPLLLIEITTLLLLRLSPMVKLTRATFFSFALMLGVFAIWALSGFGYPSSPLPLTLNVVSKMLAFVTACTLFYPRRPGRRHSAELAGHAPGQPAGPPDHGAPDHGASAIVVHALRKSFGTKDAVAGIDLEIAAGSLAGLVGPNGAGKTTSLSMMTGLLRPDAGQILINGLDVWADPPAAKAVIGVVPDQPWLFDRLSGAELLEYAGRLRGLSAGEARSRAAQLLDVLDLAADAKRLVADYSTGMRKKAMLGCALIHNPSVLFLDEPLEGVDPISADVIRRLLTRFTASGSTVLFSSHALELVEQVCDHVSVIDQGTIVASGTTQEVRGGKTLQRAFIDLVGPSASSEEGLSWLGSLSS